MSQSKEALELLKLAETAFLLMCEWRPVTDDDLDDWTPPEDRENRWDRDRAISEARRRAEKEMP